MTNSSHNRSENRNKDNRQNSITPNLRNTDLKENWSKKKLGEISKIIMGQSPSSANYSNNSNDTILIQGNQDLKDGTIVPRIFTSQVTKTSNPGDIILTVRAPVGDIAINEYNCCIGRGVCSITPKEDNLFIYYYLQYLNYKKIWNKYSQGSTFESINSKDIKNLKINIPSFDEQKYISNFLSLIDKKIELLEKKYKLLEEYCLFLQHHLFNEISNDCHFLNFEEIFESLSTKKYQIKKSDIRVNGEIPVIDQGQTFIAGYSDNYQKKCENIPLIVFGDHTTIIKYVDFSFIVGADGVKLLTDKTKENNIKFLYFALNEFNISSEGYKRHYSILKNIDIPIPPIEIQDKIEAILSNIEFKIKLFKKEIEVNKEFKRSLLSKMFC